MCKTTKATQRDGFPNGREEDTKRKERKAQEKLRVWLQLAVRKRTFTLPIRVRVTGRLPSKPGKRKSDL